jgi:hypothetical protein
MKITAVKRKPTIMNNNNMPVDYSIQYSTQRK